MEIILANPRGFCAGVDRAIEIVERALKIFGPPIHVRHEVVHNRYVVDDLKRKGAVFVEELDEIPDDAIVIFSAHGVSKSVQQAAEKRKLKVFNATCPLVTKVHMEVSRYAEKAYEVVLIGHAGHPEVEGTTGQFDTAQGGQIYLVESEADVPQLEINNPDKLAYVSQTTLSVDDTRKIIDALRQRFPNISGPRKDDICYATQNRQDAVKQLAQDCEVVLVVGSTNSSNSNRLRELAEKQGTHAYLIDNANDLEGKWLTGINTVGVTAGASAPEVLVKSVLLKLKSLGAKNIDEKITIEEHVVFSLPKELRL
ncbi:MAG TPA: 4-hydroxy-3-methylbut-2-enyl diphosphate reductase [Gammaproteobacteria bacterium]|nr:4-hydroxy-3-methylbut-2-enyl diphosphate reductase [Gammaproteobacteria bacterium]